MSANDLYHDAIMALARAGADARRLDPAEHSVTLDNPLCGDRITLDLNMSGGQITAFGYKVRGCALCEAAAAALSAHVVGATLSDLTIAHHNMETQLTDGPRAQFSPDIQWPELAAFAPVHGHKSRYECVLLPFEAVISIVKK